MSAAHRAAALAVHYLVGEDDLLIGPLAEGAQGAPQILRWNIEAVDGLLGVCRHRHKATRRAAGREKRRPSRQSVVRDRQTPRRNSSHQCTYRLPYSACKNNN